MSNRTARARGLINSQGFVLPESFLEEAFRGEYDGSNNLIYAAFSRPGSPEDLPVWQISKLTYSGANLTSITWPLNDSGAVSNDYEFAWSLRATYTYE